MNEDIDDLEDLEEAEEYNDKPAKVSQDAIRAAAAAWGKISAKVWSEQNEDGTRKTCITARKTAFVSALIHLDGTPFSFKGREYLEPIYDRQDSEILMKNARQTEKSTYLSNDLVIKSVVNAFNKSLYVSPSHQQTRQFSSEKLKPILDNSPLIAKYFQDSSVSQQVFEKGFSNGSFIFLRSAFRSADRTRGVSARNLCIKYNSLVQVEGKGLVQICNVKVGDRVLSHDTETGKTCFRKVNNVWNNGVRDLVSVMTSTGAPLSLTPDHKVYTWDGWKEAGKLKPGDYALTETPKPADKNLLGHRKALFLGLLMGDGSHECRGKVQFRNTNLPLFDLAKELASEIDSEFIVDSYDRIDNLTGKLITENRLSFRVDSAMEEFLKELGVFGQCNSEKRITFFDRIGIEEARGLLSGLFVTGGCVSSGLTPNNPKTPYFVIASFVNTSYDLCKSVQLLLQMLGIKSHFRQKAESDNGVSKLTQYTVTIRDIANFRKFIQSLDMPTKECQVGAAKAVLASIPGQKNKTDLLPITNKELCGMITAKLGRGGITRVKKNTGAKVHCSNSRAAVDTCAEALDYIRDEVTLKKIRRDGVWSEITSVEKETADTVFDIEVEGTHCFFAEMLLVHNCIDEIQDALIDQIPVIRECTSHFPDASTLLAGTPKSLSNPIEVYWKTTTQNEWLVPCDSCRKWNFLDEKNIAPTIDYIEDKLPPGPICRYCGKPIDIKKGRWVSMCPGKMMKGYRVPQLMVPWICGLKNQWLKLLWKRDNYPLSQFYNEVLGLSYDSASSPISMQDLIDICGDHEMWDLDEMTYDQVNKARGMVLSAGVDWGEGLDGAEKSPSGKPRPASYTVLTIGHYHTQHQYKVLAIKKFTGKEADPEYVVQFIATVCKNLGIQLVGVDWGHGWGVNNTLVRLLGPSHVVQFQHLHKLKQRLKWDPVGVRYHLQRNFMMSELFYDMTHGHVLFPRWKQFEPFSKDILAIYTEYNEQRREMKYDHRHAEPDDFFHSLLYCKLACDIMCGKSRRYTQIVEGSES